MWPFKKKKEQTTPTTTNYKLIIGQTGVPAVFGDTGDDVLTNDTVIQCISAIAREMKKLKPKHVKLVEGKKVIIKDSINKLLTRPNRNMTTSEFIEASVWRLFGKDNCFIYPLYNIVKDEEGTLDRCFMEMYILYPQMTTFYMDDNDQIVDVKFEFANGQPPLIISYDKIIHLKRNFGLNELMGGDRFGKPNNNAMIKTIKISESILEGIDKGANASQAVQGVIKYNTILDDGEMKNNIKVFNESLKDNTSGIIGLDLGGEYIPVTRDVKLVDIETVEYTDKKIARNFGVSQAILDGTATPDELRAFYNTTLESLIITYEQAFARCLLTYGKILRGHEIKFYHNIMSTFSVEEQFEMFKELMDRGAMTPNETRDELGMPPIEGGDEPIMSLNYIKKKDASNYQLGKAGVKPPTNVDLEAGDKDEDI